MRIKIGYLYLFLGLLALSACEENGDQEPPAKIEDLTFFTDPQALHHKGGRVQLAKEAFPPKTYSLAWTATGDNGKEGKAALYDLRYITEAEAKKKNLNLGAEICDRDSDSLHQVFNEPNPLSSGSLEIFSLLNLGLRRGVKYHFCLWAIDEVGQASEPAYLKIQPPFLGIGLSLKDKQIPGLGEKVAELGNLDQKGLSDFSVSSLTQGKVLIYFGKKISDLYWDGEILGRKFKKIGSLYPSLRVSGEPGENFGFNVCRVQDLDKKLQASSKKYQPDIAISAPDTSSGKVYLYRFGRNQGHPELTLWATLEGESTGDRLGVAIASCVNENNDLNLDNYPDFAVSAPGAGKVYIVFGGDSTHLGTIESGVISEVASIEIQGDPGTNFGSALACDSDLNGDNIPDLIISADQENANTGAIYLFLGGPQGVLFSETITSRNIQVKLDLTSGDKSDLKISGINSGENFGASIAMLGPVWKRSFADASRDFAVSAPGIDRGRVYIFWGGKKGNLQLAKAVFPAIGDASQADLILEGMDGEIIGEQISGKGDLNRDGHFDLAVSNGKGGVRVYYLLPDSSQISSRLFSSDEPISSFKIISSSHSLLIGIAGRERAYILK